MEIQRLRYFVALVRERGFAKAAAACRVSQPTLSQQIALLERELGVTLVRRLRGGVTSTDAGRAFHKRAVNILAELDFAAQEAAGHAGKIAGTLRLGAIPTIAPYALPDLVAGFVRTHPGVAVETREAVTASLETLLVEGEIDAALLALPLKTEHLRRIVLGEDRLLAAVPASHPAAKLGSMARADVAGESWLMLEDSHCLAGQTRDFCLPRNANPRVIMRAAQVTTLLGMVARGLGVAVVPEMAAAHTPAGVSLVPFSGRKAARTVALVMRGEALRASPLVRVFADYVRADTTYAPRLGGS